MKLRGFFIPITIVILCGVGLFAYARYVTRTVRNAYAVEWAGAMVVDYLRQNEDRWPQSWEDLHPIYEQHVQKVGQPWTFDELRARVEIRWDVDVDGVRKLSAPPDDLIKLRDGGREHWDGTEPNKVVFRYLMESQPVSAAAGD